MSIAVSCSDKKRLSSIIKKTLICIFVGFFLFGTVVVAYVTYPSSSGWSFQNNTYLSFNQDMNFTVSPQNGTTLNDGLVGYWSLNEGNGSVAHDISGQNHNGTLYGASWIVGKYGSALSFDGVNDYVGCGYIVPSNISITISAWVNSSSTQEQSIIGLDSGHRFIYISNGNTLQYWWVTTKLETSRTLTLPSSYLDNAFHLVVFTYDNSTGYAKIYWDNQLLDSYFFGGNILPGTNYYQTSIGARFGGTNKFMNGTIDDVRIYNRTLSDTEVAELYQQSDLTSFDNYYNFQDSVTNNTMLIHVDNSSGNSNNSAIVTCTNFFKDNILAFQANNSAIVNVRTNLGQPAFTTGVWNSNNYTTTLTLDAASTAELNWNTYNITTYVDVHSGVSPSNVTIGYGGSQAFSFNASQGYGVNVFVDGVSQGQISSYTFSNVTAPHVVNVTSALLKYTITASADSGSIISPSGDVSVNYGGSQLFTIQNKTGYNVKHVYVDDVDKGAVSNYKFSNVTANHLISVSSESLSSTNSSTPTPTPSPTPTATPTPTPSQSPGQTNSPSPTPTSQPGTNQFPTQTVAIVVTAIAIVVVVFAFAFRKGYITLEVVDEENPKEARDDYTI